MSWSWLKPKTYPEKHHLRTACIKKKLANKFILLAEIFLGRYGTQYVALLIKNKLQNHFLQLQYCVH